MSNQVTRRSENDIEIDDGFTRIDSVKGTNQKLLISIVSFGEVTKIVSPPPKLSVQGFATLESAVKRRTVKLIYGEESQSLSMK
jgi:hypothetical protein